MGGAFFVPTFDAETVRRAGLLAAMHEGVKAKAAVGIYAGRYGVLFTRTVTARR